jgi:hypothetical protein
VTYEQFKDIASQGIHKVSIGISVTPEVKAKLVAVSDETGVNLSKVCETVLSDFAKTIN